MAPATISGPPSDMLEQDLRQFLGAILLVVGAILPIVNPVGSAPMFLAMTHGADSDTRRTLAARVAINSFLLLLGSLIFGNFVLRMFGLSVPVVQLAGGLVLCAMGWKILGEDSPVPSPDSVPQDSFAITRAFYPLTLPLTVDPGAISVAVTIGANHSSSIARVLIAILGAIAGVAIISVSVWLTYRYAERVARWLGHTRLAAVLRLSAFIVLCIGVQIAWNGARALLEELPAFAPATVVPAAPADGKRSPAP
jgi:multiple antibiotic resistance protein